MKIAIIGSRDVEDLNLLYRTIAKSGFSMTHIISGGAVGVDSLANTYAKRAGLPITIHYPNWARDGKSAGMIRNKQIVDEAEAMIAIRKNKSRGTTNSIELAKKKGIPIELVELP